MLRIIDQRWREHLYEMDYLQEGINLRAMGQKDPLVEWQREGFAMFGQMMKGIAQDFVRYVMHVQVVQQRGRGAPGSEREDVSSDAMPRAPRPCRRPPLPAAATTRRRRGAPRSGGRPTEAPAMKPIVKDDGRRRLATRPAPAGAARSTSSATANEVAVRDFTDDLKELRAPRRGGSALPAHRRHP